LARGIEVLNIDTILILTGIILSAIAIGITAQANNLNFEDTLIIGTFTGVIYSLGFYLGILHKKKEVLKS
jgi:putative Mn2+ efflux pump MntP